MLVSPYARKIQASAHLKLSFIEPPPVFIFFHNIVQRVIVRHYCQKTFAGSALLDYCPKIALKVYLLYKSVIITESTVWCAFLYESHFQPLPLEKTLRVEISCGFNPTYPPLLCCDDSCADLHSCLLTSNRCLLLVYGFVTLHGVCLCFADIFFNVFHKSL